MTDPLRGITINIGGKDRTLRFGYAEMRVASRHMQGRKLQDVVDNLLWNFDDTAQLGAAGLLAERVTDKTIEQWCESDPTVYPKLVAALTAAMSEAYTRMTPKKDAEPGEGGADKAPPPTSTSTTPPTTTDGPTSPAS